MQKNKNEYAKQNFDFFLVLTHKSVDVGEKILTFTLNFEKVAEKQEQTNRFRIIRILSGFLLFIHHFELKLKYQII